MKDLREFVMTVIEGRTGIVSPGSSDPSRCSDSQVQCRVRRAAMASPGARLCLRVRADVTARGKRILSNVKPLHSHLCFPNDCRESNITDAAGSSDHGTRWIEYSSLAIRYPKGKREMNQDTYSLNEPLRLVVINAGVS